MVRRTLATLIRPLYDFSCPTEGPWALPPRGRDVEDAYAELWIAFEAIRLLVCMQPLIPRLSSSCSFLSGVATQAKEARRG